MRRQRDNGIPESRGAAPTGAGDRFLPPLGAPAPGQRFWRRRAPARPRPAAPAAGVRGIQIALFLLPAITIVGLFYVVPNVLSFAYSLTDWSSFRSTIEFVGLRNFQDLLEDRQLLRALDTTLRFAIFVMIIENVVALSLALALESNTRFNTVLRSVFFLPVLVSTLAAGYIFSGILQPDGVLNNALTALLWPFTGPVNAQWLGSTDTAIYIVGLVHAWKWGGIHMLVYIAGLKAIPREFVESARVEGASAAQIIRHVKLPLLGPAFTFNITLTLIGALAAFDVIMAMTKGGPARATEVFNIAVWRNFGTGAFAYATSLGLVLFLIIVAVAIPLILYLRKREVEL